LPFAHIKPQNQQFPTKSAITHKFCGGKYWKDAPHLGTTIMEESECDNNS